MGYDVADVDELEAEGPGGMVRKVRRAVDGAAFGFNYFTLPAGADGREHDHARPTRKRSTSSSAGPELMRVDGEEIELKPRPLPSCRSRPNRVPTAGADGLEFVTFGAPLDGAYEPPAWG